MGCGACPFIDTLIFALRVYVMKLMDFVLFFNFFLSLSLLKTLVALCLFFFCLFAVGLDEALYFNVFVMNEVFYFTDFKSLGFYSSMKMKI